MSAHFESAPFKPSPSSASYFKQTLHKSLRSYVELIRHINTYSNECTRNTSIYVQSIVNSFLDEKRRIEKKKHKIKKWSFPREKEKKKTIRKMST